jgi:hypothetical protein
LVYNAQKSLDEAHERLAVLISPSVWQAEREVETTVRNLAASSGASAGELVFPEPFRAAKVVKSQHAYPFVFEGQNIESMDRPAIDVFFGHRSLYQQFCTIRNFGDFEAFSADPD